MLRRRGVKVDGRHFALQNGFDKQRQESSVANVFLECPEITSDATPCQVVVGPVHVDLENGTYRSQLKRSCHRYLPNLIFSMLTGVFTLKKYLFYILKPKSVMRLIFNTVGIEHIDRLIAIHNETGCFMIRGNLTMWSKKYSVIHERKQKAQPLRPIGSHRVFRKDNQVVIRPLDIELPQH